MKRLVILIVGLCLGIAFSRVATAEDATGADTAEIISKENSVDSLAPSAVWQHATVGQKLAWHDRLRTGEDSRAAVRLGDLSILRFDELTEAEILPPPAANAKPTVDLKQGTAYFFSREKSREINVRTPAANGGIRGTEFVVTVAADGSTSFTMIDGEVEISNADGLLVVGRGERADVEPGGKPAKTEVSNAIDSAIWCFYYPGVLDPKEVRASIKESDAVRASLTAYSEGDPLMALEQYPRDRLPSSSEEKAYRAGLFLVAGQVAKAEGLLEELGQDVRDRQALSTLIAAVTLKDKKSAEAPQTASEWLAESYYRQSQGDLANARQAAEHAITLDPSFGFGWIRVAEIELGMGRTPQAEKALDKGLSLAPRNPAAHALRGFMLSTADKLTDARNSFERALNLDSALGDAWLGRGLCLIRQGHEKAGRRDLLTAAALEPNRAIFRSYLDKDFNDAAGETPTGEGRATPRSKSTTGPRPSYPGYIPPPNVTVGPRPYYPGLIPRPRITASPKPSSPGHSTHPERTASPKPHYEGGTPRPGTTASVRPSHPKGTPPPKTIRGATPGRPERAPRPTPSARPPHGQKVGQPKPARGAIAAQAPSDQQQAKGKKKRPVASQSPTPY